LDMKDPVITDAMVTEIARNRKKETKPFRYFEEDKEFRTALGCAFYNSNKYTDT
jgi:hypothetical protein